MTEVHEEGTTCGLVRGEEAEGWRLEAQEVRILRVQAAPPPPRSALVAVAAIAIAAQPSLFSNGNRNSGIHQSGDGVYFC